MSRDLRLYERPHQHADRMMTSAEPTKMGVRLSFADGRRGVIRFADLPEIGDLSNFESMELPNPYQRIRGLREAAGMTQEELASSAGIGRVTLVRIEKGEQSPRYETLVALPRALGLPLAELLVADPDR